MASFRLASLTDLGVPDGYAVGILAWYSLIHLDPAALPAVLQELARSTAPGGAVSYSASLSGIGCSSFHTAAYSWPIDEVAGLLAAAGFTTLACHLDGKPVVVLCVRLDTVRLFG